MSKCVHFSLDVIPGASWHLPRLLLRFCDVPATGWLIDWVPAMAEVLEGLHGVERVETGRYSWSIWYAPHITVASDLAGEIQQVLLDFRPEITDAFGGTRIMYADNVRGRLALSLACGGGEV